MRWIKKNEWHLFDGHDELYQHAKFGEDRTMRAVCRCENVVFVFFVTLRVRSTVRSRGAMCIVRTRIALPFIRPFRRSFQHFFLEGIALSDALHSSHFRR